MEYKITLYNNDNVNKSGIDHLDNQISNSTFKEEVDLLDDLNILNDNIYSCGVFVNNQTNNRNACLSNIITFDIDKRIGDGTLYDIIYNMNYISPYKFLLYLTTNDNYRLLILLDNQVMSEEYKLLWEQICVHLGLQQFVNFTMKDISRKWFATKKFIEGNYTYD
jgi:hypothetical protein